MDAPTASGESDEPAAADRGAALCQHNVQTDGSQQRAFPGHVRTADDDKRVRLVERSIIRNRSDARQERMRKSDCIEGRSIGAERGEAARGPLISKACKRAERLEVADA